jgi:CRP-like cAMP-binding protein
MTAIRPDHNNQLLTALGIEDLALLTPMAELIALNVRDTLEPPDEPIKHVYFIESGIASIVATMSRQRDIEVGVIGREGMTGTSIIQGDDRGPNHTFMQVAGSATRIGVDDFTSAFRQSPSMRALLNLYTRAFAIQVSATALANGRSKLEERLARWLLMVRDRMDTDRFGLTHEFLAVMLGVRRPGVTVALHILEGKGLIRSNRGEVIILDRDGLMDLTDGAYGLPEREYDRLFQIAPPRPGNLHLVV